MKARTARQLLKQWLQDFITVWPHGIFQLLPAHNELCSGYGSTQYAPCMTTNLVSRVPIMTVLISHFKSWRSRMRQVPFWTWLSPNSILFCDRYYILTQSSKHCTWSLNQTLRLALIVSWISVDNSSHAGAGRVIITDRKAERLARIYLNFDTGSKLHSGFLHPVTQTQIQVENESFKEHAAP
jgi:hypothetical protein